MTEEIYCDYTDEIVCPYCGYKHYEPYELYNNGDESIDVICEECSWAKTKKEWVERDRLEAEKSKEELEGLLAGLDK